MRCGLRWFKSLLAVAAVVGALWPGLRVHAQSTGQAGTLRVVASFSILADMVRSVGGAQVQVLSLVGPETDAHSFEPRPNDIKTLAQAQVLVINGLGFEAWLPGLQQASGFKGLTVVASEGSDLIDHDDHGAHEAHDADEAHDGHAHGSVDPHAWQDLGNGVRYVQAIAQGLAQADPAHADGYHERANRYAEQLRALDADIKQRLAGIPLQNRKVIVSHDAFAYFARAYAVQFIPVAGVSGRAEASARGVADLVNRVRKENIAGIFLESAANSSMVEQLARETGAKVGGKLYADTLAANGQPADTYLGMMRWNASKLLQVMHATSEVSKR
jgi:zinc/manganese transport system substrate-binding protein